MSGPGPVPTVQDIESTTAAPPPQWTVSADLVHHKNNSTEVIPRDDPVHNAGHLLNRTKGRPDIPRSKGGKKSRRVKSRKVRRVKTRKTRVNRRRKTSRK